MSLRKVLFLGAMFAVFLAKTAFADELSLSAGAFAVQSEYKGCDARVLPMPIINYEGEHFFIRNTEAGAYLWKNDNQKISIGINLLTQYFRSSKSDDPAMKQLENRNIIALATLGYELNSAYGSLYLSASGDITGTSDGFLASASYAYPLNWGNLTVIPRAGAIFASSDFNDYYYGVSHGEAARSGLPFYSPDSSITPFAGVRANYALTNHWSLFASWNITFLGTEVKDSPMVDRNTQHIFGGGITYTF